MEKKLEARIAKLLDKARQERRRLSREYIRGLLDSINHLGCNDTAISKLLRISRASVSRWRWRAYPSRENLAKLEFLKKELERLGPSTWRWPHAPESGRTPGGKPIRFEVKDRDKRMAQDAMKLHELKWASGLTWLKIAGLLGIGSRELYNLRVRRKEMRTETRVVLDALLAKYGKGRMVDHHKRGTLGQRRDTRARKSLHNAKNEIEIPALEAYHREYYIY